MNLMEFLLARIAEDEAGPRYTAGCRQPLSPGEQRIMAECRAKRRIVERCAELGPFEQGFGGDVPMLHGQGLWEAAEHLAAVYATHPDYRTDWI